jgi:hypothetical protein
MRESEAISVEKLIEGARALGYRVTPAQLKRWRKLGLLPRPSRVSRGYGRGFRSVGYPAGAMAMLEALLVARKRARRSLERTAWIMWWDGWRVEAKMIRRILHSALVRSLKPEPPVPFGSIDEDAYERRARQGRLVPEARAMRRRIGAPDMAELMRLLLAPSGEPRADQTETLLFASGLKTSRRSAVRHRHAPNEMRTVSRQLRAAVRSPNVRASIQAADEAALLRAREESRSVCASFGAWMDAANALAAPRSRPKTRHRFGDSPEIQIAITLLLLLSGGLSRLTSNRKDTP